MQKPIKRACTLRRFFSHGGACATFFSSLNDAAEITTLNDCDCACVLSGMRISFYCLSRVDISNADRLGKSETDLVNIFIEGAAQIVRWEKMLAAGMAIDHLLPRELRGFQQ